MGELDLLQLAFQYGPGLVIAILVLIWKRADDKRYTENLEKLTAQTIAALDRMSTVLGELREMLDTQKMLDELEARLHERAKASPQ